ncbi:hypothetical protein TheetDRAFT_2448, partial [Thermoanaerobacter ethanolicus JW 200]
NMSLLKRYEEILKVLKEGKIHHKAGKKVVSISGRKETMTSDHKRNTEGLAKAREKKSEECQERVDKAIQQLLKEKRRLTLIVLLKEPMFQKIPL